MGLFRQTQKNRTIHLINDADFLKLLGINTNQIDTNKLSEITYFTCVKLLSEAVAKLPLKLYRETDKGIEKASSHYLYQLLKTRPNQYQSSWNFWATVECNKNHYGNAYVYVDIATTGRGAGKIKGLYMLPTDKIEIWVDDAGIISKDNAVWYIWMDKQGKEYKINHQQILHFKTAMSLDGISGLAVQDILKTSIENAQSGQKFINNYWKQGMFSKGLLQYTGDIQADAMKTMQKKFENLSSGIQNAGRILPVPLGFSFTTIDNKLVDSQFMELGKYTAQQIAASFGIMPSQLGEQGKFNNLEQWEQQFYTDTLLPVLTMYEQEMNWKLLTEIERSQGYFFKFNVDMILRSSFKDRVDAYAIAIDHGFMTPNEARGKEDWPNNPTGDRLMCNGTFIPLDMLGQQYQEKGGTV